MTQTQSFSETSLESCPVIPPADIHIWQLNLSGACPLDVAHILTSADFERAKEFVFDRDRNRFLRARYGLRQILSSYVALDPRQLPLILSPLGKPALELKRTLGFNLSHSGDIGFLAVGRAAEIGIDVEMMLPPPDIRRLAQSVFSTDEMQTLEAVPDEELPVPFFTCWTRKEAYLKALGLGLTVEPRSVTVGTEPGRRHTVLKGRSDGEFVDIDTIVRNDRCIASLAVVGGYSDVMIRKYTHP